MKKIQAKSTGLGRTETLCGKSIYADCPKTGGRQESSESGFRTETDARYYFCHACLIKLRLTRFAPETRNVYPRTRVQS